MAYNKEYMQQYYQEHKEKIKAYSKANYKKYNSTRTEKRRLERMLKKAGLNSLEEMLERDKQQEKDKWGGFKDKYNCKLTYCGISVIEIHTEVFGVTIDEWFEALRGEKELEIKENPTSTIYY